MSNNSSSSNNNNSKYQENKNRKKSAKFKSFTESNFHIEKSHNLITIQLNYKSLKKYTGFCVYNEMVSIDKIVIHYNQKAIRSLFLCLVYKSAYRKKKIFSGIGRSNDLLLLLLLLLSWKVNFVAVI